VVECWGWLLRMIAESLLIGLRVKERGGEGFELSK
jgi:hypothetical protein